MRTIAWVILSFAAMGGLLVLFALWKDRHLIIHRSRGWWARVDAGLFLLLLLALIIIITVGGNN